MADKSKLNLLNEELDEESQKYIQESLEAWKESVTNQLVEQMEQEKQAKIEELEEQNEAYRESLKEEFTEKMLDGLNELKESIRAEVTAEVIKNNPELKIFEQVKEIVAPLVSEGYRDNAYEDTITQLSEEVETLRREQELQEGAKTLAALLAPYPENVQKVAVSLIKEGNPEEVTEQFYNILETLSDFFAESEKDDDKEEDEEDSEAEYEAEDDEDDEDDEKKDKEEDDDEAEETQNEESYINEGYDGYDAEENEVYQKAGSLRNVLNTYARS